MSHDFGGLASQHETAQATPPVGTHGDEVATTRLCHFNDGIGRRGIGDMNDVGLDASLLGCLASGGE